MISVIGDDADGAGLRARAVERALRAGERLDARDVVEVQIEVALDGGDRLFVEIGADARLRGGRLAIAARHDTAHIDCGESGARADARRRRNARQHPHIVGEIADIELFKFLVADRVDADRHILHVL